uniref:Uncharacterized protein n=1 Tax=Sinocyclocheilus grahami TaxID=75366 RepID=A0A672R7R8_SINGR
DARRQVDGRFTKEPITTLAKQINIVNNRIKTTDHFHVFATKLCFIMYRKHILYLSCSFSLQTHPHTVCTHTNIHANVDSSTLMIFSVS